MRVTGLHPVTLHAWSARERALIHGLWRLADPKIALASFVPFCVGIALAVQDQHTFDPMVAAAAFLAIFLVEVGKNAVNDLYDFRSGADAAVLPEERSPYSGGKRVLVDRLLTEPELVAIAWVSFILAAAIGAAVSIATKPILLLFGAVAALISVLYSMPPVKLAYRGLGEFAVFVVYGPGILLGAVLLAGGTATGQCAAAAVTLGILIAVVLLANELPDERADRLAGKRTLVVRLGRDRAVLLIGLLMIAAFSIPATIAGYGESSVLSGGLAAVPIAAFAYWRFRREPLHPPVLAQSATLVTYVVTGLGISTAALL